jgi:hypothetical protein
MEQVVSTDDRIVTNPSVIVDPIMSRREILVSESSR